MTQTCSLDLNRPGNGLDRGTFLAHEDVEEFEGYCCKACAKWEKEGYKKKTHHGLYCKREPADEGQRGSWTEIRSNPMVEGLW